MYEQNSQNSSKVLNAYIESILFGVTDLRLICTFLFGTLVKSFSGVTLVTVKIKFPV